MMSVPEPPKDNAGVIAPPPLIALAAVAIGLLLDWLIPVYVLDTLLSFWTRMVIGAALAVGGVALAISARRRFIESGANVEPWKPALHLATSGVYRYVRNPMYCGLLLLAGGIGFAFASDWTLVMVVPLALMLRNGVVLREERYLEKKFGEEYRLYKSRVPRWGIW
jgi:protein-S-isoprenylcysteine O-methyltransferase Ste14